MSYLFYFCSSLTSLSLNNFDTTQVTNMEKMFYNCELQVLDISSFVTNKVKSFSNMFQNCRLLKKIDTSKFETSMATEMAYIF